MASRMTRVQGRDSTSADFILPHAEGSDQSTIDAIVIYVPSLFFFSMWCLSLLFDLCPSPSAL